MPVTGGPERWFAARALVLHIIKGFEYAFCRVRWGMSTPSKVAIAPRRGSRGQLVPAIQINGNKGPIRPL